MVVEGDPVHDRLPGLLACGKPLAVDAGRLQPPPQALGGGVVPAISFAGHRAAYAPGRQRVLEVLAAILAAPVAVKDQARGRPAPKARHQQRILDQRGLHVRLQAPAHHLAAVQVQHGGQVQPTFVGSDVGDVAAPHHVGRCRREAALHQVRGHRQAVRVGAG